MDHRIVWLSYFICHIMIHWYWKILVLWEQFLHFIQPHHIFSMPSFPEPFQWCSTVIGKRQLLWLSERIMTHHHTPPIQTPLHPILWRRCAWKRPHRPYKCELVPRFSLCDCTMTIELLMWNVCRYLVRNKKALFCERSPLITALHFN